MSFRFRSWLENSKNFIISTVCSSFSSFFSEFSIFKFDNINRDINFYFNGQSFFGTAFVFGTFEFKVISSIAVIFSLSYLQREKYLKSNILISIAIYSHFLVGYFWFGVICVFYFLKEKDLKIVFKYIIKVF